MWGIYYFLAYVVLVVLFLWWKDSTFSNIPGPRGFPILGMVPEMTYQVFKGVHLDKLLPLFERFGNTFQLGMMGVKRIVFTADLENIKYIFNNPHFEKGKETNEMFHEIFGGGIFNADGENWRVQRQTASSLFHFNNLQNFVPVFYDRAKVMNQILGAYAKSGKSIDVQKIFMRYTIDSIGELGYGIIIDALKENKSALEFCESFDYVQAETSFRFIINPVWKWLPQGNFKKHMERVDNFMKDIVAQRKSEIQNGVDISDKQDLLSRFLLVKDPTGHAMFDDNYLLDVLKNFLIAGRDTTALCLTWTFYLLAQHPDVEKKVLQEIAQVVGDQELKHEHLKNLKYMKQVIDESLRLYPPIPMDERTPDITETLPSGHVIPAGTLVVYPTYAIHRLPQYWKDPLAFNPDRWETDEIKVQKKKKEKKNNCFPNYWEGHEIEKTDDQANQFVPFHGGPRVCLGQNMAYVEIKVVLCALLPLFKFKLAHPEKVRYILSLSLPTKHGMEMYVVPR
eukprot:Phypoly_transcript_07362.p1 GENE.Phypoly_transcript_07362~~Phypoly_transcript_07362.p1  ORF type:complete len:509 (+),score=83.21 Phypoly_transcript_07362:77-1603(+)